MLIHLYRVCMRDRKLGEDYAPGFTYGKASINGDARSAMDNKQTINSSAVSMNEEVIFQIGSMSSVKITDDQYTRSPITLL